MSMEVPAGPTPEELLRQQEDDAWEAQYMEMNPDKFAEVAPEKLRECEPEIAEFEGMIAAFEAKHSLEELHAIVDLTPGEVACYALQVTVSPEKLALLADPTSEDVSRYLVRKVAREALAPIAAKLNGLKEKTNISPEKYKELNARYKRLTRAVGFTDGGNKVDHER
jgi:hypothetical protein